MPSDKQRLVRWQIVTVALLVVGYAGCYLCRSNFSVTLNLIADMLVEGGLDPQEARIRLGTVASIGTLAYALGKFVTGTLADFLGGRRNVLAGMLGSVLFTLLFAAGGAIPLFSLAWAGNRIVQSLCWTGMVKITGKWFSFSSYGTAMGVVSLSYLFGDGLARWFMGWLLDYGFGWREVFWTAGAVLFELFALNLLWLKESPTDVGLSEPAANPLSVYGDAAETARPAGLASLLVPLLSSPRFLVVCLLSLGLTLLRETFGIWSPAYFADTIQSTTAAAARQSALFPLLGGASVLVAGWLGDRLGPAGRAAVIVAGCLSTAVVLWTLGSVDFATDSLAPVWLVGLTGFLMLGPYSFLAGAISLDLGGKQGGATACGIIDGVGYLGAMAAGDSVARLSVSYGWHGAFRALAGVALLSGVAAVAYYYLQRKLAT